jgi:hypothetical protein
LWLLATAQNYRRALCCILPAQGKKKSKFKIQILRKVQWHMLVITATQEAEVGESGIKTSPGKRSIWKQTKKAKGLGKWVKCKAHEKPEFNP